MRKSRRKLTRKQILVQVIFYVIVLALVTYLGNILADQDEFDSSSPTGDVSCAVQIDDLPEYSGEPYVVINGNVPLFSAEEKTLDAFETFSPLDSLGRCGVCTANVCPELMPTQERGDISSVKPTGWHSVRYDFVDGDSLYNRCHLIGFQLTGENANPLNLITGTRYMNVDGMLPFENMVAEYVQQTGGHVLYRVTPVFHGDELVARGVQMEAFSVEDQGAGLSFNVFCYNVQPGVEIDYETGVSWEAEKEYTGEVQFFLLNTSSKKFHLPSCSGAIDISEKNRAEFSGTREELVDKGYSPCGNCNP